MGLLDRIEDSRRREELRRAADRKADEVLAKVEADAIGEGWFSETLVLAELEVLERADDRGLAAAQAALALRVQMAALQVAALQARRTDRLTRSLARATWGLAAITLVLVLVTVLHK